MLGLLYHSSLKSLMIVASHKAVQQKTKTHNLFGLISESHSSIWRINWFLACLLLWWIEIAQQTDMWSIQSALLSHQPLVSEPLVVFAFIANTRGSVETQSFCVSP